MNKFKNINITTMKNVKKKKVDDVLFPHPNGIKLLLLNYSYVGFYMHGNSGLISFPIASIIS